MTTPAYVFDAVRTPRGRGKKDGALHEVKPVRLAAGLLRELQRRHDLDTSRVDDVVLGCCAPIGEQGADVAKSVVQIAGWDERVCGVQLDRFCASGLEAVNQAASRIACGWEDLIVAGGVESMSRVPMGASGGAWLQDPEISSEMQFVPQGIGADLLATLEDYSREDVDAFALESQHRAARARDAGWFDRSVIPVKDANGLTLLERDEYIKPKTTMDAAVGRRWQRRLAPRHRRANLDGRISAMREYVRARAVREAQRRARQAIRPAFQSATAAVAKSTSGWAVPMRGRHDRHTVQLESHSPAKCNRARW